jgi:hypothetical protein
MHCGRLFHSSSQMTLDDVTVLETSELKLTIETGLRGAEGGRHQRQRWAWLMHQGLQEENKKGGHGLSLLRINLTWDKILGYKSI